MEDDYATNSHLTLNFCSKRLGELLFELGSERVDPFTPESDQCQNSPAASQEI